MEWNVYSDVRSEKRTSGAPGVQSFAIDRSTDWGHLDSVEADPSGIIHVEGWALREVSPRWAPNVFLNGRPVAFFQMFRITRPDLNHLGSSLLQNGLIFEYLIPESLC